MSRDLRVADFVRDEVSRILQRDMRDPRVGSFVSVNDVKVSKDLSYAEIYVSSLQAEDAQAQAELIGVLNRAAGFFRTELAKRHTMRTTPKPRFHYDELVERGTKLEKRIGQAVSQDQQRADQNISDESVSPTSEQ